MSTPSQVLKRSQVDSTPLFLVGTFDVGVTVYSQQVRALNLVWALIEKGIVPSGLGPKTKPPKKIGIVGGGFAGLTVAAGLIAKGAHADITIFEQRDTLLPLQQGSDSRWLHPRIYDWPEDGSEANVAMLPVLNWSAARASDVVVQILSEWKNLLSESAQSGGKEPTLFCNARHLQIHAAASPTKLEIEWIGERRDVSDGTTRPDANVSAVGCSDAFDFVILAIGFGLERSHTTSYWRNETLGQPSLNQPRQTFLVSGQGDGAMIDLQRLRISQYRQDRILAEVFRFRRESKLLPAIKRLRKNQASLSGGKLFKRLEGLESGKGTKQEFAEAKERLSRRLRRDTEVILQLKVRKLVDLFKPSECHISFQNRLLVFLLYKCGAFVPSVAGEDTLLSKHGVQPDCVVRRHGTLRNELLKSVLSDPLCKKIWPVRKHGARSPKTFEQQAAAIWEGGYFGYAGKTASAENLSEDLRVSWRREYLPDATRLIAAAFCSSVAGFLLERHGAKHRLRVTMHRTMVWGREELLQQLCDYEGTANARVDKSSAARTFPTDKGTTIGLAYQSRRIVRSRSSVDRTRLNQYMTKQLISASREMNRNVGFVLAIPLLEPPNRYVGQSNVIGTIYVDSTSPSFFIRDEELRTVVQMANTFLKSLQRSESQQRIRNIPMSGIASNASSLRRRMPHDLELVRDINPPQLAAAFQLNFDYTDFVPVEARAQ